MLNSFNFLKVLNEEDLRSLSSFAISYNSYNILKVLIEILKINYPYLLNNIWHELSYKGDIDERRFMKLSTLMNIDNLNINEQNNEGDTALTYNCGWGRVGRIKSLLKMGCDPNLSDRDNESPLVWAVQSGSWEAVAALVKAGAICNGSFRGSLGAPLHRAAYIGSYKMVSLLINSGADPSEKNKNEQNLVQIAKLAKENFLNLKKNSKKIILNRSSGEDVYHIYYNNKGYSIFVDNYDKIINRSW